MDSKNLQSLQEAYYASVYGKSGVYNERYQSKSGVQVNLSESTINTIVEKAMGRVFYGQLDEVETKETREGTKYKVRVKDRQSGSSYIRFATREKIAELRANPNISSVELTDETPSDATADGTSGKTQTFGASPNANKSSSTGYQRPADRPSMAQRMASRDQKATRM